MFYYKEVIMLKLIASKIASISFGKESILSNNKVIYINYLNNHIYNKLKIELNYFYLNLNHDFDDFESFYKNCLNNLFVCDCYSPKKLISTLLNLKNFIISNYSSFNLSNNSQILVILDSSSYFIWNNKQFQENIFKVIIMVLDEVQDFKIRILMFKPLLFNLDYFYPDSFINQFKKDHIFINSHIISSTYCLIDKYIIYLKNDYSIYYKKYYLDNNHYLILKS